MLRTQLSIALIVLMTGLIGAASQDQKDKAGKKQPATITKVDAKNGTVTVRMTDKNGKETERQFKLTGDMRYFDSTGRVAAVDIFQSGDDVLLVEAEGRLRELHRHGHRGFLHAAAEIDLSEIRLGKLAQERASSAAVKKFAERMAADHAKMNKELRDIAKSHGLKFADKLDKHHKELYDQLSKLNGTAFDRAYAKDMVSGHEHAIHRFAEEAKNGKDADVKAWAERWLPTLREHLRLAKDACKEVESR